MKYLILYSTVRGGTAGVVWRDTLPAKTLYYGGKKYTRWWHLTANEDGVLHRPDGPKQRFGLFTQWAGLLPANWIDRAGNLRNAEGRVVFKSPKRQALDADRYTLPA